MTSERTARPAGRPLALLVLLVAGGCEIEKVAIPRTEARVALHGVLSASAPSQVVMLERTRNGSVFFLAPPFDIADPVVSDAGVAETDADVRLTTPDGQTLVAREDKNVRDDRKGEGIYRFSLPGAQLERGGTYRLSVRTAGGQVLTAETVVPGGEAAAAATRVFDRSRDTVFLEWPPVPGARSYFVRVESPFGPLSFFTDSTRVRLTGALRNVDVRALPRVFMPGFPQAVTVSAVDANFYDWYRSSNNEISGTGLINRVQGGFGVFGSLVRLRFEELEVVVPQPEPIAGTFRFLGDVSQSIRPYEGLTLYVESRAARADQGDALSGRYTVSPPYPGYPGCLVCGLLGSVRRGRVELAFLDNWSARDTVETLTGEIRGDTIVGTYRRTGGQVRFVRER